MEHDTIAFIGKNHAIILSSLAVGVAWFKNELKTIAPVIWKFLGDYKGIQGVLRYVATGSIDEKKQNEKTTVS